MSKFFNELKRRNVIKAAIAYVVVGWVLLQVASIVLPIANAPDWVLKTFTFFLIIGFPVWLLISWVFEVTPDGLKKTAQVSKDRSITATTNKRLNILILIGLVAAITVAMLRPTTTLIKTEDGQFAIAVLPFDDLTKEGDSEWFCVGVTEDILAHLSNIKDLRVVSRTSVMQYKNHEKSITEIAKELDVSYIVEGSVRTQGDKVLVTAQLINAEDNHLWTDNYNENLNDVFKIQQEISKKIVQQLQLVISPEEEEALSSSSTTNVEAYQLFLRGRTVADSRTKENLEKSITFYRQAIALDPNYADAYAEIANSTQLLIIYGNMPRNEYTAKSRDYVNKALAINTNTVRAYSVLGRIFTDEKKWDLAKENFEKAILINPNDATTHHHYAIYYRNIKFLRNKEGDNKKWLEHINKAHSLDPLSLPISETKAQALIFNGKLDEAEAHMNKMSYVLDSDFIDNWSKDIKVFKKKDLTEYINIDKAALEKEPDHAGLHSRLGYYYRAILNDNDNSLKHAKKAYELDQTRATSYFGSLSNNGKHDEAKKLFEDPKFMDLLSAKEKTDVGLYYYAVVKGDFKKAEPFLEQYKVHDSTGYIRVKIQILAITGEKETALKMLNTQNEEISHSNKAGIFASLKMKDSMYVYIDKINSLENKRSRVQELMGINYGFEFDSYRNEPRFKAILKANYFPVSDE